MRSHSTTVTDRLRAQASQRKAGSLEDAIRRLDVLIPMMTRLRTGGYSTATKGRILYYLEEELRAIRSLVGEAVRAENAAAALASRPPVPRGASDTHPIQGEAVAAANRPDIEDYVDHQVICAIVRYPSADLPCSCGLDDLLKQVIALTDLSAALTDEFLGQAIRAIQIRDRADAWDTLLPYQQAVWVEEGARLRTAILGRVGA